MNVHLVDATFELFRAFYSRPVQSGPGGQPVNAVRGLVETLLQLLREPEVSHAACATDYVIESWRNDLYRGYKTGVGVDRSLLAQFRPAEEAIRALGLVCWPMVEDEADDGLATAAARFAADPRVEQVVICSVDKDLSQCVDGDHVVLRDRMRDITYNQDGVRVKFGVDPLSIPDYLALVGDSADGFPGLPGWGSRSAGAVLARWTALEGIPEDPLTWDVDVRGAGRLNASLRAGWIDALLFRRLATLNRDALAPGTLDELEWHGVPRPAFEALMTELGLDALVNRVHRWA